MQCDQFWSSQTQMSKEQTIKIDWPYQNYTDSVLKITYMMSKELKL